MHFQSDETPDDSVKQVRCHSKHHKREFNGRPGRLYRAEKRYRKQKDHHGKGKTLRDHRREGGLNDNSDMMPLD